MDFSFRRSSRLLNKAQYDYVFQSAKRISVRFLTLLYRENGLKTPRLGLIVSKKTAKRSHERNRFKRIVRDSFRLTQHDLPAVDIIILSRYHIETAQNNVLFSELEYVWRKMIKNGA